jgi:hypothetical protein
MARTYASAKQNRVYGHSRSYSGLIIVLVFIVFVLAGFCIMNVQNQARDNLIETLMKEREVTRINDKLKTELAGITRARLLELKANERLGLKKPTEEEVIVLR